MSVEDLNDPKSQEFLRILAHQLKSPINTIESFLKTLAQGMVGEMDAKALYYVEKAIAKTSEARALITDLMLYSQFASASEEEQEDVDLSQLVNTLASSFHYTAIEKNIAFTLTLPQNVIPILRGRTTGLHHALRNLIDNAFKYTPPRGKVEIRLTPFLQKNKCQVTVSDTGPGIPKEDLPHLFEPFYRSIKLKGQVAGTGLGLAISRQILDQHGGTVTVRSAEGEGTVVQVLLPCRFQKEAKRRKKQKEVVIIGGVTSGPKVAARLRRLNESVNITIVEKSEFLAYSGSGLPNYISGHVSSPKALLSTAENTLRDIYFFEAIKNIRVRHNTQALEIDRANRRVKVLDMKMKSIQDLPYDVLVLATGSIPALPPIPGLQLEGIYSFYRIEDAEALKRKLAEGRAQDVVIIGGGLIGVETSEAFTLAGARVTILEKEPHLISKFMDPDMCLRVRQQLNLNGVKTVTGCAVEWVVTKGDGLTIKTSSGLFNADFVILGAGVKPNIELAEKAGLALGPSGGVRVNSYLQTSDRRIYAVGDCAESIHQTTGKPTYWPLGSISCKMGRIAADNIAGRRVRYEGSLGTVLFRIFGTTVARTGLTTSDALQAGYDPVSAVVTGLDRAHYYPEARPVAIKVVADRKSRILLGAQGIGKGSVAQRVQTLAAGIGRGLTLEEFFGLDLGFYPAFNNPIDIAQAACLVLGNKLDGLVRTISHEDFETERPRVRVLDVSPADDDASARFPGCINIPLESLRMETLPFPPEAPLVLVSRTGARAYEAYRYLSAKGFSDCRVLEGGYVFVRG